VARRFGGTRFDCGDKLGYVKAVLSTALNSDRMGVEVAAYIESLGFQRTKRQ
jgi:UTP-glucose-1-phosphate uridylyltransferase